MTPLSPPPDMDVPWVPPKSMALTTDSVEAAAKRAKISVEAYLERAAAHPVHVSCRCGAWWLMPHQASRPCERCGSEYA